MANGQLPGRVAPTSIGQGKSYSQMMNEQIGLIQQQRAANLDKRLAQEEKNRQFRTEQLQNIYDFDVSGLASGDVQVLADVQRQLAASLDPNSENSYSSSQQLVADISLINNAYNEMKRWADSGGQGRQIYQNGLLQPERGDGTVVVADEDMLNSRNEVWEKGAFAEGSVRLVGPPGNRQLVGMALDVDGNEIGEVNFFENSMRNQPDQFWRQEVVPAAPYAATLTERALTDERLDGRNTREIAEIDFAVMNEAKKNRFREEFYERIKGPDGKAFEEIKPEEYSRLGIDDDALINEMVSDYEKGLEARPGTAGADAFDFNKSVINMPQLSKPVKLRSEDEEFAGTIEGAQFQQGLDLDTLQKAPNGAPLIPVEVAYVQSNGTIVKKVLDPATNPVEYDAFMEAIGRRGKEQLLQYSGYYQTPEGPQVDVGEDPQDLNPAVDRAIMEDLGLADADASPGAKLESDRQMLLDDIADAEEELKLQMSLAGGNAGNLTGRMEAMERLVELQEQLGPINDALEELGIERIEYEPIDVSAADAGGAGAGGANLDTEPPGPQQNPPAADPEPTGPQPETERDLSVLPPLDPLAVEAAKSVSASEGYNEKIQINVPDTLNSGVTIAGLDIGSTAGGADGKMEIFEAFLSPEDYEALKPMVGLTGEAAQEALSAAQAKGLLLQDGLGLSGDDFAQMAAYHITMHQLPEIYKKIPKEEFEKMDPEVRDIFINIEFMTPGTETPKLVLKAIRSGKKKDWEAVANAYYNPKTESTYYGSKEVTAQKIANSKMENPPEGAKSIAEGNVRRVKEAGNNLRAWIEKTYS